jgi:peptidyl-prolyl cis-trans isomerase-like 4
MLSHCYFRCGAAGMKWFNILEFQLYLQDSGRVVCHECAIGDVMWYVFSWWRSRITNLGDIVIDLLVEDCPRTCENFLKLCKIKFYNFSPFYNIQKNYTCQTGDPEFPVGDGGSSIWGIIGNSELFKPEMDLKKHTHKSRGSVSMATKQVGDDRMAGSQFIITLADDLDTLDGKAALFGYTVEGFDTLDKINNALSDTNGRPFKDIRIKHTYILEDPFDDPQGLIVPPESPNPTEKQLSTIRIGEHEDVEDEQQDPDVVEQRRKEQDAAAQALTLEMVGDLPFAEVKPQDNVLFVCKLNPVTKDDDLELIFSRFGKIVSCEVIRDKLTGDSLQYAFVEFENQGDCERAYFKMDGVLIDDHRIHVDFSQSVSRLSTMWRDDTNSKSQKTHGDRVERRRSRSPAGRDYNREERKYHQRRHTKAYEGQTRNERSSYHENDDRRQRYERKNDRERIDRYGKEQRSNADRGTFYDKEHRDKRDRHYDKDYRTRREGDTRNDSDRKYDRRGDDFRSENSRSRHEHRTR